MPARTICGTVTWPLAKTMALGPVADGSIKLQTDAANVAGIISSNGSIFMAWAVAARTGIMRVVVAVLLANSVTQVVSNVTARITLNEGKLPTSES